MTGVQTCALPISNSTNELLERFGARALPVERVASFVGEGAKKLVERALSVSGLDPKRPGALEAFRAIYDRRLLEHTRPYDGIADVIRRAQPTARLAVFTNKPEGPSRRLLEAFGLARAFQWIIGGDSGFPRKPDPAAVAHLMREAGAVASDTLFVGDSMIDVDTARQAGVKMCVARYGFGALREELVLTGEEFVAETPADVGTAIERLLTSLPTS